MRLLVQRIEGMVLLVMLLMLAVLPAANVQAATGKTTIAVSAGEISVGESVTVTVKAKTEAGNTAKAQLKLAYDEDILEFVSCSATYEGGSGGSVTATASSMTVKLKAVAAGKASLTVTAGNGVETSSGSSLSTVEGCSTRITVSEASGGTGSLSKDNSLKALTLSMGELSPEFAGNVFDYTARVPGSVTGVEVNAEPSNDKASIESIAGNTDLQVGMNTIKIVVKAENGALATYTIELTREEPEEDTAEIVNVDTEENVSKDELAELVERNDFLSNSYKRLEEKYQREKAFSRSVIYVLIFIIAILVVVLINVILFYRRKFDDSFDASFERSKAAKKSETKKSETDSEVLPVEKPEVKSIELSKEGILEEKIPTEEIPKEETSKTEIVKTEMENPKEKTPKAEIVKTEIPKEETLKTEIAKNEIPKEKTSKTEIVKTEIPKAEVSKVESLKEEISKEEIHKAESRKQSKKELKRELKKELKKESKRALKPEVRKEFEVLDFNDED